MRWLAASILTSAALAVVSCAVNERVPPPRFEFDTLSVAAARISRASRRAVLAAPWVDEIVSTDLASLPPDDAIARIASVTGCRVRRMDGGTLLLEKAPRVDFYESTVGQRWAQLLGLLAQEMDGEVICSLRGPLPRCEATCDIDLRGTDWEAAVRSAEKGTGLALFQIGSTLILADHEVRGASREVRWSPPQLSAWPRLRRELPRAKVDIDAKEAPLESVVADLERQVGVRIVLRVDDDEAPHPVTLTACSMEWTDVIEFLLARSGLWPSLEGRTLVLDATLRSWTLVVAKNASPRGFAALLGELLGKPVCVRGDLGPITLQRALAPDDALRVAAALADGRVDETRSGYVLSGPPERRRLEDLTPLVTLPNGCVTPLQLEAFTIHGPDRVVISGHLYHRGDPILDEKDKLTGARFAYLDVLRGSDAYVECAGKMIRVPW